MLVSNLIWHRVDNYYLGCLAAVFIVSHMWKKFRICFDFSVLFLVSGNCASAALQSLVVVELEWAWGASADGKVVEDQLTPWVQRSLGSPQ